MEERRLEEELLQMGTPSDAYLSQLSESFKFTSATLGKLVTIRREAQLRRFSSEFSPLLDAIDVGSFIVFGTPGVGKTVFALDLPNRLREVSPWPSKLVDIQQLLKAGRCATAHVMLRNGAGRRALELEKEMVSSGIGRALLLAFCSNPAATSSNEQPLGRGLLFQNAAAFVAQRLIPGGFEASRPGVLFVVFDEVQGMADSESLPLGQLAETMNAASSSVIQLRSSGLYVVPIFVGTFFNPLVRVGLSQARRVSIPMSLLSPLEVSSMLTDTFGLQAAQIRDEVFQSVIAFAGGHARALHAGVQRLLTSVFPLVPANGATFSPLEEEQRRQAQMEAQQEILSTNTTAARAMTSLSVATRRAVLARVGLPAPKLDSPINGTGPTTWSSLVEIGLLFVVQRGEQEIIALPPFAAKALGDLCVHMPDAFARCATWDMFEKLASLAEFVRLLQLSGVERSLAELLPGLSGSMEALRIPALREGEAVTRRMLAHQFPLQASLRELQDSPLTSTVFVNAKGAPFSDVLYFLRTTTGEVVLVALQCKFTEAGRARLTNAEAAADLDKVRVRLADHSVTAFLRRRRL
jgi:hypothetical protein